MYFVFRCEQIYSLMASEYIVDDPFRCKFRCICMFEHIVTEVILESHFCEINPNLPQIFGNFRFSDWQK